MARDPSLLDSLQPTSIAPATPAIAHVQLRDLLICPREKGIVNYVVPGGIIEQDIHSPGAPTRLLSRLSFTPNSLTSLPVGQNDTLIAAGGQDKEIHLSYHTPAASSSSRRTRLAWELEQNLTGSINNSVLLTSLSLTRSNESSVEPRVGISNNDGSFRLYDIPLRVQSARRKLHEVGQVKLDVPVNHSSISPDGRTLLSVGDSNKVYFHQITGGARIAFSPITTLTLPPPDASPLPYSSSSSLAASFSTAFSGDGSKFAVASQEGVVAVWDVRSTKPVKVFQTDKTRGLGGGPGTGNSGASGWLSDDPWEWTRGTKAPGWCVRSIKFNSGEGARLGKEVMAFTEHTSVVHVVDARTFETHDIIRVPALQRPKETSRTASSSAAASSNWYRPTSAVRTSSNAPTSSSRSTLESARNRILARRQLPVSNARRVSGLSLLPSVQQHSANSESLPPARTTYRTSASATRPADSPSLSPPSEWYPSVSHSGAEQRHAREMSFELELPADMSPTEPEATLTSMAELAARLTPGSAARLAAAASSGRGLITRRTESTSNTRPSSTPMTISTGPSSSSSSSGSSPGGRPGIVQALGDAFRIPMPASAYSPPASIGDSTWRTLGGQPGQAPDMRALRRGRDDASPRAGASDTDADGSPSSSSEAGPSVFRSLQRRERTAEQVLQMMREEEEEDGEGIVVVPDLGDRDVESEVHALLAVHGISSRLNTEEDTQRTHGAGDGMHDYGDFLDSMEYDGEEGHVYRRGADEERLRYGDVHELEGDDVSPWLLMTPLTTDLDGERYDGEEDEGIPGDEDDYRMDVDEEGEDDEEDDDEGEDGGNLEFECASTGNSRSGSPSIRDSLPSSVSASAAFGRRTATSSRRYGSHSGVPSSPYPGRHLRPTRASSLSDMPEEMAPGHRRTVSASATSARLKKYGYYEDLDLAGICFDPCGERMYVAGVGMGPGLGGPLHGGMHGGYGGVGLGVAGEGVGVGAVVEWSVRGAEKRWWVDDGWR